MRTPLIRSHLSIETGHDVLLKLEMLQPVGSFKIRGAAYAISQLSDEQKKSGVACYSTGNHGRAVAYAARLNGIRATVCLSRLVPAAKVDAIEALGAEVKRVGESQDEAETEVRRLVQEYGMVSIPPFDDEHVIAGQSTVGIEILEQCPDAETIVLPVSGGGLLGGVAIVAKAVNPHIRIVGAAMENGSAMAASLQAGRPVRVREEPTLADSLGGGIGDDNKLTLELCREFADEFVLLSEEEILRGMSSLLFDDNLLVEGASAVGHGAILAGKLEVSGPTVILLTGRNVAPDQVRRIATG